ncbi:hypothetical protein Clacol_003914 [Clathrus columnatus]|uniref:Ras GTPase-activating protein n=1 Tax=Clathrus columnatus TaxID=1419009 RepID=A0AAV5A5W9_9AGAM|nr:hypothetical protein Clacol_003914 [Clathrus columnatus]
MSRSTSVNEGQWIRVRCHLIEMHEKECRLTIIGDKETLQHSLNVRLLRTTDIRLTDRSLFFRSDCLSIHAPQSAFMPHSPSLQNLVSSETDRRRKNGKLPSIGPFLEPIYLSFDSKDAVNCWNALLGSYALPEVYGCEKVSGGLFRMWRQVALTVMHARNLGLNKKLASTESNLSSAQSLDPDRNESSSDSSADSQMFCEIYYEGVILGRTIYQKGQSGVDSDPTSWTWLEMFRLSDLPPFGILDVRILRFRKATKPTLIGHVEMSLSHFRRGQLLEGWFPVMTVVSNGNGVQIGDLRLKIKVDEEVILPSEAYSSITTILDQHNCLDLLGELDQRIHLGDVSYHMLSLAVGRNTFVKDILDLAEREVENAPNEASVGPSIAELCSERVELETDPSRNTRGPKDVEQSIKQLHVWCTRFWTNIYNVRDQCPLELRRLFQCIRELVERRFGGDGESSNLKWQSVSAFCFLRLIVPAILHPHLWGLHPGLPSPPLQRSLTLIAKALQSLANLSKEKKESHMQGVSNFLEQNREMMISYINQISNPLPERSRPDVSDKYDRLLIIHSLRDLRENTKSTMPLFSESIPILPYLLDIPKHLAVLSSAVTRQTGSNYRSANRPLALGQESLIEEFALKCFEIDSKIMKSIDILTSYHVLPRHYKVASSQQSSGPSSPDGYGIQSSMQPASTPSEEQFDTVENGNEKTPIRQRSRASSNKRPSTAPATSNNEVYTPLPSPIVVVPHGGMSDNSAATSPPTSPINRMFHNPFNSPVAEQPFVVTSSVSTGGKTVPTAALRRTMSQQLDLQEIEAIEDVAKRRKKFLPAFLARAPRQL